MNDDAVRLFPIPRAAEYLGTTTWAIRRLIWDKKLLCIRLGKRLLIDKVDLDAFVEARKKEAA